MVKWIVGMLLIVGIFSSPVTQGVNMEYNTSDQSIEMVMSTAKKTIRNVLVVADNIVEVLILNLDSTTTFPPNDKDLDTKTF